MCSSDLGEFLMIGALVGLACYVSLGLPFPIALAIAVAVTGLMGIVLERVAIRPVIRHVLSHSWVLSTVAISIILKNVAVNLWGPEQMKFPSPFGDQVLKIGSAGIFPQELFIIVCAVGTVLLVQLFLKKSVLGKALMAVANNRNAAAVVGIHSGSTGTTRQGRVLVSAKVFGHLGVWATSGYLSRRLSLSHQQGESCFR